MNEYIILHDSENYFHYIPTKDIQKWKIADAEDLCNGNKTLIYFHNGLDGYLCVKEFPFEIETLIMGYDRIALEKDLEYQTALAEERWDDGIICAKERDKLAEKNSQLKDDIEKLKEENAKLKDQLAHSNPDNPCCRETFGKLVNYYNGGNISHFCASEDERVQRGHLECWRQSFRYKIQENKND